MLAKMQNNPEVPISKDDYLDAKNIKTYEILGRAYEINGQKQ